MTRNDEERVLVLSALPVDASLVCTVTAQAGISAQACGTAEELCAAVLDGAGAAVIAQEALSPDSLDKLAAVVEQQPAWSDFPFIIALSDPGLSAGDVIEVTARLGNVMVLHRPLHVATLVTALRTALRARRRQYEVRRWHELEARSLEHTRAAEVEAVMDAAPVATFIARDPDCRTIVGSRMTYELLRLPLGTNLSKSAPEHERPKGYRYMKNGREIPPAELPVQTAARTGKPTYDCELELVFDDGVSRILLGNAVPLLDEEGRSRGAVAGFLDVTERTQMEERLRQAQKMESIGLLAGGVAHDFNNLLAGVMGYASLLRDVVPPENHYMLDAVLDGTEKAADLTRQLLAYAGKGRFVVGAVDVSALVHDMTGLLKTSLPRTATLQLSLSPGLPSVEADRGQIEQIVMNLLLNAAEAVQSRHDGSVSVFTYVKSVRSSGGPVNQITGEPLRPPGDYVCIEVRDNGPGIDAATRARIFEPFFTTKFMGRGLGLAAAAGVVTAHAGAIEVESAPGGGATFRVYLPASDKPVAAKFQGPDLDLQGAGAILVVDDEPRVLDFVVQALSSFGYRVLSAENGSEAVEIFDREAGGIDVVIVDLVMPVMSGEEAVRMIRNRQPDQKIILMTAYGETEAAHLFASADIQGFLQKPFTPARLAAEVKAVLSRTALRRRA